MDDGQTAGEEESRLLEILRRAALNDFPNPDRIGCPGTNFLRRLAVERQSIALDDPALSHVTHCSPCFRELEQYKRIAARRMQNRRLALGVVAASVTLAVVGIWEFAPFPSLRTRQGSYRAASLDLTNSSTLRGTETPQARLRSLLLPQDRLLLTVILPFASETGEYDVQICRTAGNPLLMTPGKAYMEDGNTLLKVRLDLTQFAKGTYLLGVRRASVEWTYHSVQIG